VPPIHAAGRALRAGLFLAEFHSEGRWRPLSALTTAPARAPLPAWDGARPIAADLYATRHPAGRPGLVVVHGLAAAGKDDARVREAAGLLARAGWTVAVPSVEGLMRLRLRPEDAGAVVAAGRALREAGSQPVAILAVSVGAGPALAAAADPALAVSAVMTLGGYASARELLRFTLTGDDRGGVEGGRRPDEAAIAAFVAANPDLVDEAGRRLVDNRDPAAVDALLARLPATSQRMLDALSPERWVGGIRGPLFLVHGHDDPAVPVSESVRLAAAAARAGGDARLVVVRAVGHVEPGAGARLSDLARLAAAFYAFLIISAGPASSG
jgi:pimeloyl-ACP methyl ester carboxylesterase